MDEDTLLKYLTHKCSPEELEEVERLIAADPSEAERLFEMERIWSLKDELQFSDGETAEKSYAGFLARMDKKNSRTASAPAKRKFSFLRQFRYVAAAVVIIIGLGGVFHHLWKASLPPVMATVEVPAGQLASLTLSDGTKVWLNSQSKFTYPEKFKGTDRTVSLEGEGYFEVAHDEASPFIVETASVNVKVLGTKFDLKAYDEISSVALREGKVKVSVDGIGREVLLSPNEQAVYRDGEDDIYVSDVDIDSAPAWIGGTIVFDNTPLVEVLKTLTRHYGIGFDASGIPADSMSLTMKLTDEPLEETLKYISLATDVTCEMVEDAGADGKTSYHVRMLK